MSQENHNPFMTLGSCWALAKVPSHKNPFQTESESWRGWNVVIFSIRAELKGITLSERSQTQTVKYHMTSYPASRRAELIGVKNSLVVRGGLGAVQEDCSADTKSQLDRRNEVWCCLVQYSMTANTSSMPYISQTLEERV